MTAKTSTAAKAPPRLDPRLYQIGILAALLAYGVTRLDFDITAGRAGLMLATALLTQYACTKLWEVSRFDTRSALISGLSLCLLLRTNYAGLAMAAAIITIASKFVLRVGGKHIFNPTNFGIATMLLTGQVWVSPSQWGNVAFFAFLMACLGGLVVNRAARSDVTVAFICCYMTLVFGRSLWLGEPMSIPIHRLESGALLLFTFFMISDPRTTPNSRAGRILFAALVAWGAWYVQFRLFRTNGLLWSLAGFSVTLPLIDWLLQGSRYEWSRPGIGRHAPPRSGSDPSRKFGIGTWKLSGGAFMKRFLSIAVVLAACAWSGQAVLAFCGFYVAKADTKLFNKASQVVLVRHEDKTVLTMANDFKGDPREFAVVIPVPTVLQKDQIHVGDKALLEHLDAYSAPRLVEYFDQDPCIQMRYDRTLPMAAPMASTAERVAGAREQSLGIRIEAQYTVGEYDILILSAQQSNGLETWLRENGYRIPAGASAVLNSYVRQNLKFFVAKVNLLEQAKLGYSVLRPIQVAYESPKFMLPIRLGMVNADGPQELFVYALTRRGRVEATNYRTVKLPTGMDLPVYVKDRFRDFYPAMFSHQAAKENMSAIFTEYAWD
ncbi:MAG: DUF2330 domain-containing protein, partial [Acidobacteria bacterium]|nr:DUF2330 domain-containing protein [Acidobacteriota bacterium]